MRSAVKRLRLRDNWPLWAAIIALLLAILHIIVVSSIFHYPFESAVIYPLLAVARITLIGLACFTVVTFLYVEFWACAVIPDHRFGCIVFLGLFSGIVLCVSNTSLGFILIVITLFVIVLVAANYDLKRGLASLIALIAFGVIFLLMFWRLLSDFQHLDAIRFEGNTYNLALLSDGDFDCLDQYFIVYQCDGLRITCNPVYRTESYYQCLSTRNKPFPKQSHFTLDRTDSALYVQIGDERTLIAR